MLIGSDLCFDWLAWMVIGLCSLEVMLSGHVWIIGDSWPYVASIMLMMMMECPFITQIFKYKCIMGRSAKVFIPPGVSSLGLCKETVSVVNAAI